MRVEMVQKTKGLNLSYQKGLSFVKKRPRSASTDLQLCSSIFTVSLNNNIKEC